MFDRTDLEMRINAHENQISTVNRTQWQSATAVEPAGALRRQIAAMLVSVAAKLDGASLTPVVPQKPAESYVG